MAERESNNETQSQTALQEEYLKSLEELEEGQLVEGKVIEIGPENVFVDVGYKSEGKIPLSEFTDRPEIGDTVNVAARLVSMADPGEMLVSDDAYVAAGLDDHRHPARHLELKGRTTPVGGRVQTAPTTD